jgi:Domain of unknown function (DUF4372)/Transposase DDE domain
MPEIHFIMNQGKYVFAQLIEFLSHNDFLRCVAKYNGNYKVKSFTCWHQLLYMMFGQLSNRESLSDLITCLNSQANKSYHLGMGKGTSKANLAKANEKRDYRIYEEFTMVLIKQAQKLARPAASFTLDIVAPVYAIDATIIDLCLNVFWWGTFKQNKAAIKIHAMLDVKTSVPTFAFITEGIVHEVTGLGLFPIEKGSYYILDRGYIDFERLYNIHKSGGFFVMRAKINLKFIRVSSQKVDKIMGIKCDQRIKIKRPSMVLRYPEQLRRVKYYDRDLNMEFVFLTNNFEITSLQVAELYKHRWAIELFFKWIKQHLKVKTFWGYSFNAVKTQVYIALITYLLIIIVKHELKLKQSQYEILQILSISLVCKTPLLELFSNAYPQYVKELPTKQLNLFTL